MFTFLCIEPQSTFSCPVDSAMDVIEGGFDPCSCFKLYSDIDDIMCRLRISNSSTLTAACLSRACNIMNVCKREVSWTKNSLRDTCTRPEAQVWVQKHPFTRACVAAVYPSGTMRTIVKKMVRKLRQIINMIITDPPLY